MRAARNNDLANSCNSSVEKIIRIGETEKKAEVLAGLPHQIRRLHESRTCWIHDLEFYDITYNCIGINPSQLISDDVGSFSMACLMLYSGIVDLTNMQSGGIGLIDFDSDMSRYIRTEDDDEIEEQIFRLLILLNLPIRKGCERAYVTFNFGLSISDKGRKVAKALLKAYSRRQFTFPNLVFKVKQGINRSPSDVNYDLFQLACNVTSQCMNPTFLNTDASFNKDIPPHEFGVMGCRTRIAANRFHDPSSLKRGNLAAVTINLVQLAINSDGNKNTFNKMIEDVMNSAKECLLNRLNVLIHNAPMEYLREKDLYLDCYAENNLNTIKNGTLAIGIIGLWDAIAVLHNVNLTDETLLKRFFDDAYGIVKFMRKITDTFSMEENLNFSLLASSAEGVSGYFADYDKKHFDKAKVVTDKGYYTNSFHIPVNANISCFDKILLEAPFHALCNGGHITYVELLEAPVGNTEAILELVEFACMHDIGYFGINFPLDVCRDCSEKGIFEETCAKCGSHDIMRLRRVSGYLSDKQCFTFGKSQELSNRVSNQCLISSEDILTKN